MILILIASMVQSCNYNRKLLGSTRYPDQISRKYYSFSDEVNELGSNSLIDTTAVYLSIGVWTLGGKPQKQILYSYIRFSGKGVAFISNDYSVRPSQAEFESMPSGVYCFYKLNDNKITLEVFDYHLKLFQFWHGIIDKDKIVFTDYKIRTFGGGKGSLHNYTFRKETVALKSLVEFPTK